MHTGWCFFHFLGTINWNLGELCSKVRIITTWWRTAFLLITWRTLYLALIDSVGMTPGTISSRGDMKWPLWILQSDSSSTWDHKICHNYYLSSRYMHANNGPIHNYLCVFHIIWLFYYSNIWWSTVTSSIISLHMWLINDDCKKHCSL